MEYLLLHKIGSLFLKDYSAGPKHQLLSDVHQSFLVHSNRAHTIPFNPASVSLYVSYPVGFFLLTLYRAFTVSIQPELNL